MGIKEELEKIKLGLPPDPNEVPTRMIYENFTGGKEDASQEKIYQRLGEYEDTGVTPEEIKELLEIKAKYEKGV